MTEAPTFLPDWISPPGETIEDLLEENGWTKAELAERSGFTPKHVNEILKGRAPITADTAGRLSRVLGSTAEFWLTRESQYRAALERRVALDKARADSDWLKELPLAWMKKQGWVEACRHPGEQVLACLRFFGVASVEAWRRQYEAPLTAFRASGRFQKKLGAVAAWLREGERQSAALQCEPYDRAGFKEVLRDLRQLTTAPQPSTFVPRLVETCARHGVAVVFVPAPAGCPASGATKWLTPDKAILQLSLRYRTNDHLWFTFFHEAGHLLLHGKKLLFIEGIDGLGRDLEEEADAFARDWLIPPPDARRLARIGTGRVSKKRVTSFAETIGVAPGVVVGRMQNEGWLPWTHLNDLKVRYSWPGDK